MEQASIRRKGSWSAKGEFSEAEDGEEREVRGVTKAGHHRQLLMWHQGHQGRWYTRSNYHRIWENVQALAVNRDASAHWEGLWQRMQNEVKLKSCSLKAERLTPTLLWGERREWKWQRKINRIVFYFKGTLQKYIKISPWAAILSSWSSFLPWADLSLPKPKQLLVMLGFLRVTCWKPGCSYFWCVFPLQCKSSLQIKRLSGEDISSLHLSLHLIKFFFFLYF